LSKVPSFRRCDARVAAWLGAFAAVLLVFIPRAAAQDPQLQQRIAEIKQYLSLNKQAVALYAWQESQTTSVKGDVKNQGLFQVQMGPNGQPQKTALDPDQSSGGRRHGIKHRIEEDYEEYGQQIAALAQSYAQPDPGKLRKMFDQGNVKLGSAGAANESKAVISGYLKPGDSPTIIYNKAQQAIQSPQIASCLNDPSDAVKISAQYAQLPNGPNHIASMFVDGVSKQLTVQIQNTNYQRL